MNPGDIQPQLLGITLPSAGTWLLLTIALVLLITITMLVLWAWYTAIGDDQYADPEIRARMHLDARVSPLGDRIRPNLERLAEPQRSRALRIYGVLTVALWTVIIVGALILTLYWHFVL